MTILECKMEDCTKPIRIKKLGLCQMHETRQRHYGDPNHKSQRKSFLPVKIPGGEDIWDYQKAKKITTIISNTEKMIMCGYIVTSSDCNREVYNQIGELKYSKSWFCKKYIKPILETKEFFTKYYEDADDISSLVNDIIENGKSDNYSYLKSLNLESFGIKRENEVYSFIDLDKDLGKKCAQLNIDLDNEEDYEICHKLKIHYNRYKKLMNKD